MFLAARPCKMMRKRSFPLNNSNLSHLLYLNFIYLYLDHLTVSFVMIVTGAWQELRVQDSVLCTASLSAP